MSLREDLNALAENRQRIEFVHESLPGKTLWIQEITGGERDDWEKLLDRQTSKDGRFTDFGTVRAKLIQLSVVDESGAPLYAPDELAAINKLPGKLREDLWEASSDFNGLSGRAKESELKNCESEAGNGSDAASPSNSESPTFGRYLSE